jgi:hypothetical protein
MTGKNEHGSSGARSLVGLPRELAPPADAWDRIAARLSRPESAALPPDACPLPAEIEPPADLWPAIASRLATRSRRRRMAAALAAAAALAIMLVTAIAVREGQRPLETEVASVPAPRTPIEMTDTRPYDDSTSLGAYWTLRMPEISSEVAATLRRELELVRDERVRIEQAMDTEPANTALRELWAHAYEVELELADACGRTVMAYEKG